MYHHWGAFRWYQAPLRRDLFCLSDKLCSSVSATLTCRLLEVEKREAENEFEFE